MCPTGISMSCLCHINVISMSLLCHIYVLFSYLCHTDIPMSTSGRIKLWKNSKGEKSMKKYLCSFFPSSSVEMRPCAFFGVVTWPLVSVLKQSFTSSCSTSSMSFCKPSKKCRKLFLLSGVHRLRMANFAKIGYT